MGDKYYGRVYNRFKRQHGTVDTKSTAFQEALAREYDIAVKQLDRKHDHEKGEIPNEVIEEMLKTGLIITGSKACGKSNVAKILISKILRGEVLKEMNIHTAIFDTCLNWRFDFEAIPFQEIVENTRFMWYMPNILFDVDIDDSDIVMEKISEYVRRLLHRFRLMKKGGKGEIDTWLLYCVEEAQNILGTYSLSRNNGKFWLKFISESRNFNTSFIFIGQRLADISTKVIERAQGYLFGRMTGDNDRLKVKRICGVEMGIHKEVAKLGVGEFIYWNGEEQHNLFFDEYDANGQKPFEIP